MMIKAKLGNIIWSLVVLHLVFGVAPAWGVQNVWELKDGRYGIDLGKQIGGDHILLVDDKEEIVPDDAVSGMAGYINPMSNVMDGTLTLRCVGDQSHSSFSIFRDQIEFARENREGSKRETIEQLVSSSVHIDRFFLRTDKNNSFLVEAIPINYRISDREMCGYATFADRKDGKHVQFIHRGFGSRDGRIMTACCSFEKPEEQ